MKFKNMVPILFVWLWSTGFIGAKYGLPYIEPYFMLLIRFLISMVIFILIMLILHRDKIRIIDAVSNVFTGILLHGCYLGGVFFAIDKAMPAGIVAIIVGLQPILTVAIGWIAFAEPINKRQILGFLLGFIGVVSVIIGSKNVDVLGLNYSAFIACLIALIGISMGTIVQKRIGKNVPLLTSSIFQYLGAAFVMLLLTYTMEEQYVEYTVSLFVSMTWLILGLSVLAILLLMYMIREGELTKVSSYFYLVPPVTVLQTWIIFDETMGILSIAGCLLSIIGVYLIVSKKYAQQR